MRTSLIAAVVLGLAGTAAAQPRSKAGADAAYAEGQQAYSKGNYLDAAEKFEAAWLLDPDPAYLFNIV